MLRSWLRKNRFLVLFVLFLFFCFFLVYALYDYPWGVAGYAALLALAGGLFLAGMSFARFAAKHGTLSRLAGQFPTERLPSPDTLLEEDYTAIIEALEAERARLEWSGARIRQDAEEYYTLWAHQIKTPIAALRLLLQSRKDIPPPARAELSQELFRIEQYVDMVLHYQRLSSLQGDLDLQRYSLDALAKQAAKNCASLFIHKKLPFSIEGVRGSVITDKKWFVFVLEQLYTNALKYTDSGHIRIYSEDESTLVVEDTGRGIPPEDLPRVFERGFTGSMGRAERSSTGIGLYLCREICKRLGFSIRIASTAQKGTRVFLDVRQEEQELLD